MTHDEKVRRVAAQLQEAARTGARVGKAKATVSHFVPNPYAGDRPRVALDLRDLNEILSVDPERRLCVAEPGVPFDKLVAATLRHGLIPETVPELKEITVGGAVAGCSIESMSYVRGGFHDSCVEYEVVTGDGRVLTCSPDNDAELFHMLHGSYGTLGVITRMTFRLIPAKPFVRVENRLFKTFDEFWAALRAECRSGAHEFIDGIIHGPDALVLCVGDMVGEAPYASDYTGTQIYYRSTLARREDFMTAAQYFFRYDTECHWLTRTFPPLQWRPVRALLGRQVLGSTNLIRNSERLKSVLRLKRRPEVVVDVFIPAGRFEEFYRWYERDFVFWPLWIVPYKMPAIYPWVSPGHAERVGETFMIDAAVYGKPNSDPRVDWSHVLERKVTELAGVKTLISRNHYTESEFWTIYDRERITALKARTDPAGVFPGLYEKFAPHHYRSH